MSTKRIIGPRKPNSGGLEKTNNLFELVIGLRGDKPFHPKGIFRFKTWEKKAEWDRKIYGR